MSKVDALANKYMQLAHAMQTGVAQMMSIDASEVSPKHLRVGVNSALLDSGALAQLLIEKGIITQEELLEKLVERFEAEVKDYESKLSERMGVTVTLG